MLHQAGFKWAILGSIALHITVFLTVPIGGPIGKARARVVTRLRLR